MILSLEEYIPLTYTLAKRYYSRCRSFIGYDELAVSFQEVLLECIESFDPNRGVPFEAYLRQRVRFRVHALIDAYVRERNLQGKLTHKLATGAQQETCSTPVVLYLGARTELQLSILAAIKEHPEATGAEIVNLTGCSLRTYRYLKARLKKELACIKEET